VAKAEPASLEAAHKGVMVVADLVPWLRPVVVDQEVLVITTVVTVIPEYV
jgi:CRISPR/Cas system CMR subunit Cmr4 (Cas7 group RAMP superfamily)